MDDGLERFGGSLLADFELGIGVAVFEILSRGTGSTSGGTDLAEPIAVILTGVDVLGVGGAGDQGQRCHECDCELRAHFLLLVMCLASVVQIPNFGSVTLLPGSFDPSRLFGKNATPIEQFRFGLTVYITRNVSTTRAGTARRNIFWKTSRDTFGRTRRNILGPTRLTGLRLVGDLVDGARIGS
jgi:hypothetical protein